MKGIEEGLAQHAHGNVRRRAVHAGFGLAVRGEVLQRGDHAAFVAERRVALEAAHRRDSHARYQVRIFAVGLLDAAPARLARHIHHRRQRLVRAAQPRLGGGHGEQRLHQFRVKGGPEPDRLRKAGAADGRVAVQALLVKDHGDAEPAVLDEELLDGVGEFRHAARVLALAGIAGTAHLAEPASLFESGLGFGRVEIAVGIHQRLGFLLPDAHHLRGLFLQRHASEQVFHPPGSGQCSVPIGFGLRGGEAYSCGLQL